MQSGGGHRKPRKLLPSHLHGITAISLKQPPPFRLSFSASQFRHVSCPLPPPPTRFTERNLNTPRSITPCRTGILRRMSKFVGLPEICQCNALFSIIITIFVSRNFESRTRTFLNNSFESVQVFDKSLDRTRNRESYGKSYECSSVSNDEILKGMVGCKG